MIYDIIKIILYNLFFISLLYYDKRIGILIIILLILYWIKINSLIKNKVVEGFDLYFRDIFYMPDFDLDQIGFGSVLPNRAQYNSDYRGSSTTYSFFKGGGQSNVIKSDNISLYQETEKLLKELTEFLENKKDNCLGSFKRGKCSKKCGYGEQKVTYELFDENMDDSKCEHKNGDTYYDECFLKPCDNEKSCKSDFDCRSNNCLNGICSTLFDCDKNQFLDNCKTKEDCLYLNERYDKEKFKYTWDGVKCNQDDKYTYSGTYDTESNNEDISEKDGIKFKKVSGIGKPDACSGIPSDNFVGKADDRWKEGYDGWTKKLGDKCAADSDVNHASCKKNDPCMEKTTNCDNYYFSLNDGTGTKYIKCGSRIRSSADNSLSCTSFTGKECDTT